MAFGPGKYDALATYVREAAGVSEGGGVVVIVIGGKDGPGFSVQGGALLSRAAGHSGTDSAANAKGPSGMTFSRYSNRPIKPRDVETTRAIRDAHQRQFQKPLIVGRGNRNPIPAFNGSKIKPRPITLPSPETLARLKHDE